MFVVLCLMKTYQITSVSKLDECWERFLSVIFQDNQYLSPNCEINREGSIEEIWSMLGLLTWDKKKCCNIALRRNHMRKHIL